MLGAPIVYSISLYLMFLLYLIFLLIYTAACCTFPVDRVAAAYRFVILPPEEFVFEDSIDVMRAVSGVSMPKASCFLAVRVGVEYMGEMVLMSDVTSVVRSSALVLPMPVMNSL